MKSMFSWLRRSGKGKQQSNPQANLSSGAQDTSPLHQPQAQAQSGGYGSAASGASLHSDAAAPATQPPAADVSAFFLPSSSSSSSHPTPSPTPTAATAPPTLKVASVAAADAVAAPDAPRPDLDSPPGQASADAEQQRASCLAEALEEAVRLSGARPRCNSADSVADDDAEGGVRPVGVDDFTLIKVIGKGSFAKVLLVRKKDTGKLYAMKVLNKPQVVKRKQVAHTKTERNVLARVDHPYVVRCRSAFQTPEKLYFVLDYCAGGELFFHLSRLGTLSLSQARVYAAELVLALEHLHSLGVAYRDIKPENMLLDSEGHLRLADFGLAKDGITRAHTGANSLCGTPEYLAPEVLERRGHGTAVDWWGLGMVLYEMLTGLPPWYTRDKKKLFRRLRTAPVRFPQGMDPDAAALITLLLNREPSQRLGARGADEVKAHAFFRGLDWDKLMRREIPAPIRPKQAGDAKGGSVGATGATSAAAASTATPNVEDRVMRLPVDSSLGGNSRPHSRCGSEEEVPGSLFRGFTFDAAAASPSALTALTCA